MILIDPDMAREQFAMLDPNTAAMLMEAMENDLRTCTRQLQEAAVAGNGQTMARARHSLKGLCGAFGADALNHAACGPLDSAAARDALLTLSEATIAAIRNLQ